MAILHLNNHLNDFYILNEDHLTWLGSCSSCMSQSFRVPRKVPGRDE